MEFPYFIMKKSWNLKLQMEKEPCKLNHAHTISHTRYAAITISAVCAKTFWGFKEMHGPISKIYFFFVSFEESSIKKV